MVGLVLLAGLTACTGDDPVTITPKETRCDGVTTAVRDLAPMQRIVVTGDTVACVALAGGDREYLLIPQLTGAALPYGGYGFRLGDPASVTTAQVATPADAATWLRTLTPADAPAGAQAQLDARLRRREREAPVDARVRTSIAARVSSAAAVADSVRTFSVLNTLEATAAYSRVTATLRYAGTRVLVYVDTLTRTALTDAELAGMGALYDQRLLPTATAAFGDGSDIDGNSRVIFLLTPIVNAMVTANACSTSGFVRGFFYSHDLSSTEPTSNRGEIFYAFVPDETGRFSCSHTRAEVLANVPPTFIHELQHMISYGEHAIRRGGTAEESWLNEGLSHISEELGAVSYETRYPAPTGRTVATQLFPDSAAPYITPDLTYSYRYLFASGVYSITSCQPGSFCSLAERGGTWLFLRWLADHQSEGFLRRLVQTDRTGRANLDAAIGRPTAAALGDFAIAVNVDSIVGVSRAQTPDALRFSQARTLRRLYRALFDAVGLPGGISRPFPLEPITLAPASVATGTMRPGTFLTYRMRIPAGTASAAVRFQAVDATAFPASSGAQLAIIRMP